MDDGLDPEKIAALHQWGSGLRADPRPELAAAGRAIELLLAEVERLSVEVERLGVRAAMGSAGSASGYSLAEIFDRRQREQDLG